MQPYVTTSARNRVDERGHTPTTRPALAFPSSLAGLTPAGTAAAAILVMLIELVFVAKIASGRSSAANDANIDCFSGRDSETACPCTPA